MEDAAPRDLGMAVNYFALDDRFTSLRPAYYVLSDPMFFRDSACRDRVAELYRVLAARVAWPMTLYVQYYNPEHFDYRAALPNPLIRIVPFHTTMFRGFRSLEFWLYRHGLGSANFGTVVQVGEYIGLLLGYRCVELYGVDHTLLEGLCVDADNRLCRSDRHYYDEGADAGSAAHLPEGAARALYDGLLPGGGCRAVPRPRGAARLCPVARRTDRELHALVDDRRLRATRGVIRPYPTDRKKGRPSHKVVPFPIRALPAFPALSAEVAAGGDDLRHGEVLRIVDIHPLDTVHDGHPGTVADAAVAFAPERPREDEEGAGLDVNRLDGLRAGDVVQRVVQRMPLVPGEGLDALGAERRVVFAGTHFAERIGKGRGADEGEVAWART